MCSLSLSSIGRSPSKDSRIVKMCRFRGLVCLWYVCAVTTAHPVAFQQSHEVEVAAEMLHVVIDFDYSALVEHCATAAQSLKKASVFFSSSEAERKLVEVAKQVITQTCDFDSVIASVARTKRQAALGRRPNPS